MVQSDLKAIVKRLLNGQYLAPSKTFNGRDVYKVYSGKMNPECYCTETIVEVEKRSGIDKGKRLLLHQPQSHHSASQKQYYQKNLQRASAKPKEMRQRKSKTGRYLEQHHIDYLKEHGEYLTMAQLEKALGFSQSALHTWCKKLKITPTKSFFQFVKPEIPKCEK